MKLTLVKKVLHDGSLCSKCVDVLRHLESSGLIHRIHEILEADERNPFSSGMLLAGELGVGQAPFFVVTNMDGRRQVFTSYFRFAKEVLGSPLDTAEEFKELMNDHPDLDYL